MFKTKLSIQLGSRHFLFEVNRISISGEIFKKLCASHHASIHNSEKSCYRKCAGAIFLVRDRKKKMCIIRQPVNFYTENDTPVYFIQFFTLQCTLQCRFFL